MSENTTYYEGDIIILKSINDRLIEDYGDVLEVGVPYYIDDVMSSGSLYINLYGKDICISSTQLGEIEHIPIVQRYFYEEGDNVSITKTHKVGGATKLNFNTAGIYKVVKVLESGGLIIDKDGEKLWIKANEISYIKPVGNVIQEETEEIIEKIEGNCVQHLIDKALDERNYDKLKELVELKR